MDYRIPYAPPDITSGAKLLLGVLQNNREQDRADYNTQINATNANNAFVRESAQAARESDLAAERKADRERQKGIEAAGAFGKIKDLVRRSKEDPGAISEAMVLGKAYGIDVREAAKKAGEEDAAKQQQQAPAPLPTLLQAALPVQPQGPGPIEGDTSVADTTTGYAAPTGQENPAETVALNNPLSFRAEHGIDATTVPEDQGSIRDFPQQPQEYTPPANVVKVDEPLVINADVPTPPMPPTPDAAPSAVSAPPQMAAATVPQRMNPLFEAVMGGQTYQLGGQGHEGLGLEPEYETLYKGYLDAGVPEKDARLEVFKQRHEDRANAGKDTRLVNAIAGRTGSQSEREKFLEAENAKYRSTPEERDKLARIAAASRTTSAGAGPTTTPLANLAGMAEAGASMEELAGFAAEHHLNPKQWEPIVQNIVRNAAAGERSGQRREALVATDDTGKVLGNWKDANVAKVGEKQIEAYHRVKERLAALIDDIKSTGSRTDLDTNEIQRRISIGQSVVAALRPFNELSNTAAGAKMESDILGALGTPGHGWLWGANLGIVQRLATEAEGQHQAQLNAKLRPGGGSSLAPALGGPKRGGTAHPAEESVGATRNVGGVTYRKVGPNNWQPVTQ